jgi:crotonobetainyl-CoA:carnitine CoA-transferase CaiB-like acyl-CoA transferase
MLAALRFRDKTGKAIEIDFSQVEGVASFLGGEFIEMQRAGHDLPRTGNHLPGYILHGVYPTVGDDRWCAVSIQTEDNWKHLIDEVGRDAPLLAGRLDAARDSADAVDAIFADWTRNQDERALTRRLQDIGIAAGPVLYTPDLLTDPNFEARGILQESQHGALGETLIIGSHIRLDGEIPALPRPSPLLGEHTDEVLQELGLSEDEVGMLYVEEILA